MDSADDVKMLPFEVLGMAHYDEYEKCTKQKDWKGVCKLNGINIDSFGTKKELKVLSDYLENDEVVFALCSGVVNQSFTSNDSDSGLNTWLVALTNKRFLFLNHAYWTDSIDTQSVRHDKVQAVNASQGWLFGKIIIDIANRSIVIDNCNKQDVKIMAERANTWYSVMKKYERDIADKKAEPASQISIPDEIRKLGELKAEGLLTEEEFQTAKEELLKMIGKIY